MKNGEFGLMARRLSLVASAVLVILSSVGSSHAGLRSDSTSGSRLAIYQNSRVAFGHMGAVRNTSNTVDIFRCWATASDGGCEGTTASDGFWIWSQDLDIVALLRSVHADSLVWLQWDEYGQIIGMEIETNSKFAPKTH